MTVGGTKHQYLATVVVNLHMLATGFFYYFIETRNVFYAERFHYGGDEYYMRSYIPVETLLSIGGIIGSILISIITMKFGRKTPLLYLPIPLLVSFLIISIANNYFIIKLSMILTGFYFGGVYVIAPLYLLEIANDRFRGVMLTSLVFSSCVGEMIYLICQNISIVVLCFVILWSVIATISLYRFFPDTPLSLYKRKKFAEAEESIRFYKNIRQTDENQLETLKQELDRVKNAAADGDLEAANQMNPLQWADFKTKHARKALAIGLFFAVLNSCCGVYFMTSRAMLALQEYPTYQRMSWSQSYVQIVTVLGSYAALQLVDRVGRKTLIMVSTVGMFVGLIIYGVYNMQFHYYGRRSYLDLITTISSLSVIFFGFLGIQSLKFTIFMEYIPDKIKEVGLTLYIICGWILTPFYATLYDIVGDYVGVFLSAVICLVGVIVIHFIPETKNKSRQEIMKSF